MRLTKTRKRIRLAFVLIAFACALSGEGTVTVYQAKASPEAQILPVSDEKPELVKGTQEGNSSVPSASQKAAAERVCARRFSGKQLSQCYYDILAWGWVESRLQTPAPIGDAGLAYGNFQLHIKLHGITEEQANDFEWAANWTLERAIKYGYADGYRTFGIGSHNSLTPEVNARYSKIVKEKSAEFERAGL